MFRAAPLVLVSLLAAPAAAAPLSYYLPEGTVYDEAIPTPEQVIGHEVGEWHITHDRLVQYMRALADASDRVMWQETGRTHEGRPLLLLVISSPANLARLERIRTAHLALSDPRRSAPDVSNMPAVAWLGYSVHGNEPSGSNAAPVVAYHLAAAQDEWTRGLLDDTVILFDPSVNPDGLQRFSSWVNSHRGHTPSADRQHREHAEVWPGSRSNHYWFDLNRDWLLLVHPESQARIAQFQRWRPNVLTDHHEMGTDATFFFQPGVESRQNPLLPRRTYELHMEIGRYHAAALDEAGVPYYTREGFDDFYLGKGSTYPDVQGSIGILFEQASSRGHLQESQHGDLAFPFTIRNQVLTAFSTLRAVRDKRVDLLRWQREFAEQTFAAGRQDAGRGWVFGDDGDPARARRFVEILLAHAIEVHPLAREVTIAGATYRPGHAWVVPSAQPQYLLARGIFETRTQFADRTFYDVSTWTLPLAFGLPYAQLGRQLTAQTIGPRLHEAPSGPPRAVIADDAVAYAIDWGGYFAPRALYRLLDAGVRARVATQPATVRTTQGARVLARGSVIVPAGLDHGMDRRRLVELLAAVAADDGVIVHSLTTGFADEGVDVGSPSLRAAGLPRIALLVGQGVNSTEAGEVWHLLDRRFGIPVTLLDRAALGRADLTRYTHIVMVDGNYAEIPAQRVKDWVRDGGVLVATKRGARWAADNELAKVAFRVGSPDVARPARRDYEHARGDSDLQLLRGAIFETDLDVTHPLGWGAQRRSLPVFRDSTLFMDLPDGNPYATVARHRAEPLLSGYVSPENLAAVANSASVVALRHGRGTVVLTAENLNFRGYWYGTNRVFLNALFFSGFITDTAASEP